jgi:hypothetical protein
VEAARCAAGVPEERDVASAGAAPVDDGAVDLVAARQELALERRHEHAEVRRGRARVHLGDEEDAHRCAAPLAVSPG